MAVKTYRPTSPGTRFKSQVARTEGTSNDPHKPLLEKKNRHGGRDNRGFLSVRHRGGGHKRRYRIIDFRRDKRGVPGRVETIEYDPNRTANIALVCYADGERRYILAPSGLLVGATILAAAEADIVVGNALPMKGIPLGTTIHNIEMKRGKRSEEHTAELQTLRQHV